MTTATERLIQEKLDELIERTTRIEAQCMPCAQIVERNRRALYGNGEDGILIGFKVQNQRLESLDRMRWWLIGCCGTATIGVFLLLADRFIHRL